MAVPARPFTVQTLAESKNEERPDKSHEEAAD
jgi:hypothetical protein